MSLIDDEVRKSFPGFSDSEIKEFYDVAKSLDEVKKPEIYQTDLSHAKIIRELGWAAFKEYLRVSVGDDYLDDGDIIALTNAASYLRDLENTTLYAALFSSASEASSRKTVSARKKSFEKLSSPIDEFVVDRSL